MTLDGASRNGAVLMTVLICVGCPQTDPSAATDGMTDGMTDGVTDSDSSGGDTDDVPSACTDVPQTQAELTWTVEGWPSFEESRGGFSFDGEVSCTVASVAAEGAPDTALDCEEDGTDFSVSLSVPEVLEGRPAWVVGDEVVLRLRDDDEENYVWVLSLRRPTGELLLTALESPTLGTDEFFSGVAAFLDPLEASVSESCGGAEGAPLEVQFAGGGSSLSLFGGQRGSLPASDDEVFAIDLSVAEIAVCCSAAYSYTAVIQRVVP